MPKLIHQNKKARFHYELLEKFEAGLVLQGSEIKAVRLGRVDFSAAYATVFNEEVFLKNAQILPYQNRNYSDHNPARDRKLLLHKSEIRRLIGKIKEKRLTLVPTKLYLKNGLAKVEIWLCQSKKKVDKRATIKKREAERQMGRYLKKQK